jgi:hypothetical protein
MRQPRPALPRCSACRTITAALQEDTGWASALEVRRHNQRHVCNGSVQLTGWLTLPCAGACCHAERTCIGCGCRMAAVPGTPS